MLYRRLFELGIIDQNLAASVRGFQVTRKHKKSLIDVTSNRKWYYTTNPPTARMVGPEFGVTSVAYTLL